MGNLSFVVCEVSLLVPRRLSDPDYAALRYRLEAANAAAVAALVEARRRVRLNERQGE